jgi:hypothetical protein
MNAGYLNASLLVAASAGLLLGARLAARPLVRIVIPHPAEAVGEEPAVLSVVQPDSLAAVLVARDAFRVARRPASVVYDPTLVAQPSTPPPPKPALVLVGIVWDGGHDPAALVEGLPGTDGPRPVRRGETVGGLHVMRIVQNRVVITGLDTTWNLTVREPWR